VFKINLIELYVFAQKPKDRFLGQIKYLMVTYTESKEGLGIELGLLVV